jgi:putative phosphoribosyl transferase
MTPVTLNPPFVHANLRIPAAGVILTGDLTIPVNARGLVIFAHGSGSSRLSPRNRRVAEWLHHAGLGTLLFDLLTPAEEEVDAVTREHRFDIELLAVRLAAVTDWIAVHPDAKELHIGYFGASTGAAAALVAAAMRPQLIRAVVSRGGRPDLAGASLGRVTAPTLLIVGSRDTEVVSLNQLARHEMTHSPVTLLQLVPGATHLFEERGALELVGDLACNWFEHYLAGVGTAPVALHK